MEAEIIAVGSELLGTTRLDTNSLFLTRELQRLGVAVVRKMVVPDCRSALAEAIVASCQRVPLVLSTGGLGPTEDDLTAPAAAQALGIALIEDPMAVRRLHQRFRRRHSRFTHNNLQQALRLATAQWLPNPIGSAMGQWCPAGKGALILLPGPPAEMQRMFLEQVLPRLERLVPRSALATRVVSVVGLGESRVDAIAAPLYGRTTNPATSILVSAPQQVELHFTASSATAAAAWARAERLARQVSRRLGNAVFSREQQSLPEVVGQRLIHRHETLAVAESCTGGLLGAALTDPPGASEYFVGGILAYSNAVKQRQLGVPAAVIRRYGAVSAATARAMAVGVCERLGAGWGLAITGIAGPGGGSHSKPVGTVFVGISRAGGKARSIRFSFSGDRDRIRRSSVQMALNQLRLELLLPGKTPRV